MPPHSPIKRIVKPSIFVEKAIPILTKHFQTHQNIIDAGHGVRHALDVMEHSRRALEYEPSIDAHTIDAIMLASLLHDADETKFFSTSDHFHARQIVKEINWSNEDAVVEMIDLVSTSQNGNTPCDTEWKLFPRVGDRLEAMGEVGIARCYSYAKMKTCLYTPNTPRVTNHAELEIVAPKERFLNYKGKSDSMIDHFYDKLVHLNKFECKNEYFLEEKETRMKPIYEFLFEFGRKGCVDETYLQGLVHKYCE